MSLPRKLRLAGIATLGLALSTEGWTSLPSDSWQRRSDDIARVAMVANSAACRPGVLEEVLADWLESAKESEFASETAAEAFDHLVELVAFLHDFAQDLCL
jgi:hypothetical protein